MKNKAVVILKLMTTFVIILIGVAIWLFLNQPEKPSQNLPKEPEIKKEDLDINSEFIKNLPYPNMQDNCSSVEKMGRYAQNALKVEDIELAEKIDTAYKKLAILKEASIPSKTMREYVETYWGKVEDYQDFTFSINNTNYTYNEEEKVYYIEVSNEEESCEESIYAKRFKPVLISATKDGKKVVLDYVLIYYIEDSSDAENITYHIYQDKALTNHIEMLEGKEDNLNNIGFKNKSKLEHYSFIFEEKEGNFYFVEGRKSHEAKSLEKLESLDNVNLLSLEEFCFDFDENSVYQKKNFSLENIDIKTRLLLAFHYSYKNELINKEKEPLENGIEYIFEKEEVKQIYQTLWGEELKTELENFELFNYQGILEETQYRLKIKPEKNICSNVRKYIELKQENIYQKEDIIYVDYKIRFIEKKGNTLSIYQNKNYENPIKENIRKKEIYNDYWDLDYVTYRYVFKKQENGKYYFLEGLYI